MYFLCDFFFLFESLMWSGSNSNMEDATSTVVGGVVEVLDRLGGEHGRILVNKQTCKRMIHSLKMSSVLR